MQPLVTAILLRCLLGIASLHALLWGGHNVMSMLASHPQKVVLLHAFESYALDCTLASHDCLLAAMKD